MNSIKEVIEKIEFEFDGNYKKGFYPFGSCQYQSIESAYRNFLEFLNSLGKEKAFELLSIKEYPTELEYVTKKHQEFLKEFEIKEGQDKDDIEYNQSKLDLLNKKPFTYIKDFYEFMSNAGYDLWSAAECSISIPEIITDELKTENDLHGLSLAITTFLYGTPIEDFNEFDT